MSSFEALSNRETKRLKATKHCCEPHSDLETISDSYNNKKLQILVIRANVPEKQYIFNTNIQSKLPLYCQRQTATWYLPSTSSAMGPENKGRGSLHVAPVHAVHTYNSSQCTSINNSDTSLLYHSPETTELPTVPLAAVDTFLYR